MSLIKQQRILFKTSLIAATNRCLFLLNDAWFSQSYDIIMPFKYFYLFCKIIEGAKNKLSDKGECIFLAAHTTFHHFWW